MNIGLNIIKKITKKWSVPFFSFINIPLTLYPFCTNNKNQIPITVRLPTRGGWSMGYKEEVDRNIKNKYVLFWFSVQWVGKCTENEYMIQKKDLKTQFNYLMLLFTV